MYPPQICGTRLINETDINIMVHGYKKQNKRKFYSHPPKKKKKLTNLPGSNSPFRNQKPHCQRQSHALSLSLWGKSS